MILGGGTFYIQCQNGIRTHLAKILKHNAIINDMILVTEISHTSVTMATIEYQGFVHTSAYTGVF